MRSRRVRPGDIFNDDLGHGYDPTLAVHIYHHFRIEKNLKLRRRRYAAAKRGACLMVVDLLPDLAQAKDSIALMFALSMLLWTQEGDAYTRSEYTQMWEHANLDNLELKEVVPPQAVQAIVARK